MDRYIVEMETGWKPGVAIDSALVVGENSRYIIFEIDGYRTPIPKEGFPVYNFNSFGYGIRLTFKTLR